MTRLSPSRARLASRAARTTVIRFMESLIVSIVKAQEARPAGAKKPSRAYLRLSLPPTAGLPALHGSEPGQVRKEAATAIFCKCRGSGSPPVSFEKNGRRAIEPAEPAVSRFCRTSSCEHQIYLCARSINNRPPSFSIHRAPDSSSRQKVAAKELLRTDWTGSCGQGAYQRA